MVPLRGRVVVVFAVGVFVLTVGAVAGQLRFIPIDVSGASQTAALDINPAGTIVGSYVKDGVEHGFVMRKDGVETIDYPGSGWTQVWGISPRGDIVGQYGGANNTVHGFVRWNGSSDLTPVDIDQPTDKGPANSMPWKINASGTIAGCLHQSLPNGTVINSTMHGWVLTPDGVTVYPAGGSMHTGVNPSGAITGHLVTPPTVTSYLITEAGTEWFSYPGAPVTRAYAVAPNGDVVGFYRDAAGHFHGFLRHNGEMTPVDVPNSIQTRAQGINAQGDIVGFYDDAAGRHGFLLTRRGSE